MPDKFTLYVEKPGMLTTVQDFGRTGYQQFGVPVGGAMDLDSMVLANQLVGNPDNTPVLEITLLGPHIRLEGTGLISIAGADLSPTCNGDPFPMNEAVLTKDGGVIKFGRAENGCRAYLAVAGNWKIPSWLGSVSPAMSMAEVLTPKSIVEKEDRLVIEASSVPSNTEVSLRQSLPNWDRPIRILPGPEFHLFGPSFIEQFIGTEFSVLPESNRMGYRLGPLLELSNPPGEIISSGILPGTIQITHSGQPIVLMRDAQTTGGYPRLANVLTEGINRLAQKKPGEKVRFAFVTQL